MAVKVTTPGPQRDTSLVPGAAVFGVIVAVTGTEALEHVLPVLA